jgi:hypothetical protein
MGNLGISFDDGATLVLTCFCVVFKYILYCGLWEKVYFYSRVFKKLSNSSYFFAAIFKSGPFCFVVLEVSVYVLFLWLWR